MATATATVPTQKPSNLPSTSMMAPKREASQSKDASPPKRMRSNAAQPVATMASTRHAEIVPEPQPNSSNLLPSSSPSTGTLPSTPVSVPADAPVPYQEPTPQMAISEVQREQTPTPPHHPISSSSSQPIPATVATTIATVGPTPVSRVLDPKRTATCPEPLLKHIQTLSAYSNPEANTFALGHILPSATWGAADTFEDRSKILCNPKTNEPINIWILGHITNTWFMKNGAPDNQCSVTILPLSLTLANNEYDRGLVHAVRWQSPHGGGILSLFNSIYDAREVLKSKSVMQKLDISYLEKRALVLIETHLQQYRQKDENGRWTISKAQFELQAVYLLQEPCIADMNQSTDSGVEIAGLEI
ncbi:hypothetical protein BKA82DRAFT_35599 [Pisolithus tinctorius]|uniref:Uncharacterized protein n=1 Tax=Pisolithus tinctorius Marx 270 TaxID=870435 RepID=A0A0C3NDQ6_PISTI|nr:hypothetical protein BKA82DRAFT_35599 [Pisolithus tinctorius]KIN93905.1 hypothetical protein M404DRAFT_35599 [Pisolithus tinctorius Marx 270]